MANVMLSESHLPWNRTIHLYAGVLPTAMEGMKQSSQIPWRIMTVMIAALATAAGQEGPAASQLSTGTFSPRGSAVRAVAPQTAALAPVGLSN